MTKVVQLSRGDAANQNTYTGPEGELTADTTNDELRLHDGSTPGGRRILNRDANDVRYQAKNPELGGFDNLDPLARGVVTRVGAADYRFRSVLVDADSLTVTNSSGYLGDIVLSLAATVASSHSWTGDHNTSGSWSFSQSIQGNLVGNVTGFLTGDVLGNLVGNVTGNAQGDHTGSFTGDVDVTGSTLLLDDNQISVSKVSGLTQFVKDNGFPTGAIVLWSGIESAIPAGWTLCNGLNSTPDLRDKFIVGAGAGGLYTPGDSGGADSLTPTLDIDAGGAHAHTLSGVANTSVTGMGLSQTTGEAENEQAQITLIKTSALTDSGHTHVLSGTATSAGNHNHGGTVTFDNRPQYYSLCYIMKE